MRPQRKKKFFVLYSASCSCERLSTLLPFCIHPVKMRCWYSQQRKNLRICLQKISDLFWAVNSLFGRGIFVDELDYHSYVGILTSICTPKCRSKDNISQQKTTRTLWKGSVKSSSFKLLDSLCVAGILLSKITFIIIAQFTT